jgi:MOSC domain-containing protein YiiM
MSELLELMQTHRRPGRVEWIGLTPARREPMVQVERVQATVGKGLVGDRHAKTGRPSKREVTLVQAEHLPVIGALLGQDVGPEQLRRNLLISGINLYALRRATFRVGGVLLEGTGTCDPCRRMEENLGPGGFSACRGHAGITARVLEAGELAIGDAVVLVDDPGLAKT